MEASFAWLIPRLQHNYIRKYNEFLSIANPHPNFNDKSSFPLSRVSNPNIILFLTLCNFAFQLTSWPFHYLPFVSCLASSPNQQGGMDALFDGFLLSYKIMILSFGRKKKKLRCQVSPTTHCCGFLTFSFGPHRYVWLKRGMEHHVVVPRGHSIFFRLTLIQLLLNMLYHRWKGIFSRRKHM